MTIRKLTRDREGIDPIRLYGLMPPEGSEPDELSAPARLNDFSTRIRDSIEGSLANTGRLQGIRVEALFRSMVVALGGFHLLTEEDSGDVYFDDAEETIVPPDFRVVDRHKEQILIEVKGVPPGHAFKPFTMRAKDVAARARYADLTGAPLLFAIYWPDLNRWTLVPEAALEHSGNKRQIKVTDAVTTDQMVRLGDALIGTVPPLTLTLELRAVEEPLGDTGQVLTEVQSATVSAAGVVLDDSLEANIAWTLMIHGPWEVRQEQTSHDDGTSWRLDLICDPSELEREALEPQGFVGVGMLSALYSSMFNGATLDDDGAVKQLAQDPEPIPGVMGTLIPADYWSREKRDLQLWKLEIQPAT